MKTTKTDLVKFEVKTTGIFKITIWERLCYIKIQVGLVIFFFLVHIQCNLLVLLSLKSLKNDAFIIVCKETRLNYLTKLSLVIHTSRINIFIWKPLIWCPDSRYWLKLVLKLFCFKWMYLNQTLICYGRNILEYSRL